MTNFKETPASNPSEAVITERFFGFTRRELQEMGPKRAAVAIMRAEQSGVKTETVLNAVFPDLEKTERDEARDYGIAVGMGWQREE